MCPPSGGVPLEVALVYFFGGASPSDSPELFRHLTDRLAAALETHRIPVRSVLKDPKHELRAQMLATFLLYTGSPTRTVAVPINAAVRESDGSMTVFVTKDGRSFERRKVQLGGEQSGYYPVQAGLAVSERIAGNSAIFLSNALALQAR